MVFDYPAKSGKRRVQARRRPARDRHRGRAQAPPRRRAGAARLQATAAAGTTCARDDINAYLKEATGDDFSAKDFRTWSATVLAARRARRVRPGARRQDLAQARRSPARSRRPRTTWATRPRSAARPTSTRASSTPTGAGWCSTSDVLEDALEAGGELPTHHPQIERAVLDLLDEREAAPGRGADRGLGGCRPAAGRPGRRAGAAAGRPAAARLAVRASGRRGRRLVRDGGRRRLGGTDRRGRLGRLRDLEHRGHRSTFIPDP